MYSLVLVKEVDNLAMSRGIPTHVIFLNMLVASTHLIDGLR